MPVTACLLHPDPLFSLPWQDNELYKDLSMEGIYMSDLGVGVGAPPHVVPALAYNDSDDDSDGDGGGGGKTAQERPVSKKRERTMQKAAPACGVRGLADRARVSTRDGEKQACGRQHGRERSKEGQKRGCCAR
jgi:hypothetical protein